MARDAQRLRQAPGQVPRPRPERLARDEAARLAQLHAHHPEVAAAIALVQDVVQRVRERPPDQLDPWLARAAERPLAPLQRLAKGSRDDDEAVKAGIPRPWSHGPVAGPINRLKMLKRQRCGRAKRALLQQRVLVAASGRCAGRYTAAWLPHQHGAGMPAEALSTMRLG